MAYWLFKAIVLVFLAWGSSSETRSITLMDINQLVESVFES